MSEGRRVVEITNRPPVILETTVAWKTAAIADALEVPLNFFLRDLKDGRTANPLIALWLGHQGFNRQNDETQDPKSGIMEKRSENLPYRLRCGQNKIHLSPSKNRGKNRWFTKEEMLDELSDIRGFILVFTQDMPDAPVWSVAKEQLVEWVAPKPWKGLTKDEKKSYPLSHKWEGDADKLRAKIVEVWEATGRPAEGPAKPRALNLADLLSIETHGLLDRLVKAMATEGKDDRFRQALAHIQQAWLILREIANPTPKRK